MKEINGYLLVKCPDYEFEAMLDLQPKEDWYKLDFIRKPGYDGKESIGYTLPKGNYSIIGLAKDLTEEQWKGIVDSKRERGGEYNHDLGHYQSSAWKTYYRNYRLKEPSICIPNTATESGHSLLKANNLNPDTTLILKNENR